ncbi:MAG: CDP-alcohol phosphatidyltransferase family protein [Chloroflexota bacterium]
MTEPHPPKSKFRFYLVSIVTLGNLFFGLLSLVLVSAGQLQAGAICLILGAILDAFDGSLARRWEVLSPFGAQLDSLADMVAFGVAISWLCWNWLVPQNPSMWLLTGIVCALPGLMSAIRLARFNSSETNPNFFEGVPTTAMAGFVVLFFLTNASLSYWFSLGTVALVSLLMVSRLPYPKLKYFLQIDYWWVALVPITGLLIWNPAVAVLSVGGIYILLGIVFRFASSA